MKKPLSIDAAQLENASAKAGEKQQKAEKSVQPSTLGSASKVISGSHEKWTVPNLKDGFDLEDETKRALHEASHYMNDILSYDDLYVEMEMQQTQNAQGHVKDKKTGNLVNSYEGTDMLKLYSQNKKERGIIVDGRV